MSLSAKDVEQIMRLVTSGPFSRMVLEMDGLKLELDCSSEPRAKPAEAPAAPATAAPAATAPAAPPPPPPAEGPGCAARDGLVEVKSPLLGIFYHAPKPGEPPFVTVGSTVAKDSVVGIIEVMKLMNSARAGVDGEIVEIIAPNGEMVEHGQTLMLVRPR